MLLRRALPPPLADHVECLWASERGALAHPRERNLPTGRADLVITLQQEYLTRYADNGDRIGVHLRGGLVQGPRQQHFLRDTSQASSVVGVQFRPGGAAALIGAPLGELAGRVVAFDDLWGARAWSLRERLQALSSAALRLDLLETVLLQVLQRRSASLAATPEVQWALRQFDAQPATAQVEPVRAAVGWSAQRFIAQFRHEVGMAPKQYCRLRRFNAVVERVAAGRDADWAEVALDGGYSDQPHLIREFKSFAGLTPGAYHAVSAEQPNHVAEPEKIFNTGGRSGA
jgi:AraC-like DNA-binding protein